MGARSVDLRNEHIGRDERHLHAKLVDGVGLVVEGHDFGPGTAPVSDDGEYEYRYEIPTASFPELLRRTARFGDRTYLVADADRISYADVLTRTAALALRAQLRLVASVVAGTAAGSVVPGEGQSAERRALFAFAQAAGVKSETC